MNSFTLPISSPTQLQEMLDELKGQKLPDKTLFGDLQGLVPVPYSKFDNQDNPRGFERKGS